jgi:2-dehydropantoate 2-reductase
MPPTAPKFVIVGAGAVGGSLAVQLHRANHHVEVVARGPHLDAIRRRGLTRLAPDGPSTVRIVARASAAEVTFTDDVVVVLATKVHQSAPVLDEILARGGPEVPIVCVQNGVEGERLALRRFRTVLGCAVNVPAAHLEPGEVRLYAEAPRGVLDVGRYPAGTDDLTAAVAAALTDAEFLSEACPRVMGRKWAKLLDNVGNALEVLCGPGDGVDVAPLVAVLRAEAEAVVEAAGIALDVEGLAARSAQVAWADIGEESRPGGSTWQSVARGTGTVETLALNGEITLLGRLHGIPTPANDLVAAETVALVSRSEPLGSRTVEELLAAVGGTAG